MSIPFNGTASLNGLVQFYEKECGFNRGDVSGDTNRLKEFAAEANSAFDAFLSLALSASGSWQFDDSNQTDYPIIRTNLVSGQRDYSFGADGSGNLILDVYKVLAANSGGIYSELDAVDQQQPRSLMVDVTTFTSGQNVSGTPTRYDATANAVFLDPVPNYNYTNGLKVYINREPSYFAYTDTTKKPGVPGNLHDWFYVVPALKYARRKAPARYDGLNVAYAELKGRIVDAFSSRQRGVSQGLTANVEDSR